MLITGSVYTARELVHGFAWFGLCQMIAMIAYTEQDVCCHTWRIHPGVFGGWWCQQNWLHCGPWFVCIVPDVGNQKNHIGTRALKVQQ